MKYDGLNVIEAKEAKVTHTALKDGGFFYILILQIVICMITFNVLGFLSRSDYKPFEKLNGIFQVSASEYPGDTFTREEKIKFVSRFLFGDALYVSGSSALKFELPLKSGSITVGDDGTVKIVAEDFAVVRAAENGIVFKTGITGDLKYVEIKHTENIVTRYYGMDFLGVKENYVALQSAPLGTVTKGTVLEFSVIYKGKNITNSLISDGELKW